MAETLLPVHPLTGLTALGVMPSGRIVWPVKGAAEGDDPDDTDPDPVDPKPDVSLEELKTHLAELGLTPGQIKGRLAASRKWEDRAKGKDAEFAAMKVKADEFDSLIASTKSDHERDVEAAKADGAALAKANLSPQLVRTEIKAQAALAGMTDAEALKALTDRLDTSTFLDDNGDIDTDEVGKYVKSILATSGGTTTVPLGQGRTRTDVKPSVASGRELYEANRKKRTA